MGISFANIIIILLIVLILFGAGKLPKVMGDLGNGLKNFKDALKDGKVTENDEISESKKLEQDKKDIKNDQ